MNLPIVKENAPQQRPAENTSLKDLRTQDERPREKMMQLGPGALSIAELMAVIIGSGSAGENVIDLCQRIINDHDGKLKILARTNYKILQNYRGIGEVKALQFQAALELCRRYQGEDYKHDYTIRCSSDAWNYLRDKMCHLDHEELWVMLLDRANHVIGHQCMSSGGVSATVADVKMILRTALQYLASGIILAHNHPSDNPTPSRQDDGLTTAVSNGCKAIDITLFDHIIVCNGQFYSYAERGRL